MVSGGSWWVPPSQLKQRNRQQVFPFSNFWNLRIWTWKRDFADGSQLKILRWNLTGFGAYPVRAALRPYKKTVQRDFGHIDTEANHVTMDAELELCSPKPRGIWNHWKLEEAGKGFPLEPLRESSPIDTLIQTSDLQNYWKVSSVVLFKLPCF